MTGILRKGAGKLVLMKVSEIKVLRNLLSRMEPNESRIEQYRKCIGITPPIEVNQDMILIDGEHRLDAFKREGQEYIEVTITETESEQEILRLSGIRNAQNSWPLTDEEKRSWVEKHYPELTIPELSEAMSVHENTILRWTKEKRDDEIEAENREIMKRYGAKESIRKIAEEVGLPKSTVYDRIVAEIKKSGNHSERETGQDYNFRIFNIWNPPENTTKQNYPGYFPRDFMEELVLRYTKPDGTVYDPFVGGCTTVDVSQDYLRKSIGYDRSILAGREEDINEWDITNGLPEDLPDAIDLVFLDPPYWIQGKGKYGDHENNLANMSLEDFNRVIENLIDSLEPHVAVGGHIAFVISMTRLSDTGEKFDHAFDVYKMLEKWFEFEERIILPYPRYVHKPGAQKKAREERSLLPTYRDLLVFRKA